MKPIIYLILFGLVILRLILSEFNWLKMKNPFEKGDR